jgi:hypothetical protein
MHARPREDGRSACGIRADGRSTAAAIGGKCCGRGEEEAARCGEEEAARRGFGSDLAAVGCTLGLARMEGAPVGSARMERAWRLPSAANAAGAGRRKRADRAAAAGRLRDAATRVWQNVRHACVGRLHYQYN